MLQEVYENEQISAMKMAVEQVMEWMGADGRGKKSAIARLVLDIASESTAIETSALAEAAQDRLARALPYLRSRSGLDQAIPHVFSTHLDGLNVNEIGTFRESSPSDMVA